MKRILIIILLALWVMPAWAQDSTMVKIGQKVPNFKLIDPNGAVQQLDNFKGRVVVVTFLYTQCPYPDKCPLLAEKLAKLRTLLANISGPENFQLLSITVDPERDTPEHLKQYAQGNDRKASNWTFLTGKPPDVAKVAALFGMLYWTEKGGVIEHNMRTAIIDPSGKLVKILTGNDWKPGELGSIVRELLQK